MRGQGVTVIHVYMGYLNTRKICFANPRETWGVKGRPKLTPVVGEGLVGSGTVR